MRVKGTDYRDSSTGLCELRVGIIGITVQAIVTSPAVAQAALAAQLRAAAVRVFGLGAEHTRGSPPARLQLHAHSALMH